jgi:hypothetical protein
MNSLTTLNNLPLLPYLHYSLLIHLMKKILLFLVGLSISIVSSSQDNLQTSQAATMKISVSELKDANLSIESFFKDRQLTPKIFNVSSSRIFISIALDQSNHDFFHRFLDSLGYVINKKTSATDYNYEMVKLEEQIQTLSRKRGQYNELLLRSDSSEHGRYFSYAEAIIDIDAEIAKKRSAKKDTLLLTTTFESAITIVEQPMAGGTYDSDWVNMPGLEYSFLQIEQPKQGFSPKTMHGVSLKYMFYTDKSYAIVGLYRNFDVDTSTTINEIYTFAFGQDFYSRKMGRGQRKYFNLYTSFNIGAYISSSEVKKESSTFLNPFLGLELIKTRNILLDSKVGYFLPFKNNRNQRGLLLNASFNFVF